MRESALTCGAGGAGQRLDGNLGGQLTGRDADGMSAAALYWYVTVLLYSVIYFGIYITKF